MKAAISIPDDLFDRAERLARRMELSRSELYHRAVREFVAAHDAEAVTETLNRIHGESEPGTLDRIVDRLRDVWIDEEIW